MIELKKNVLERIKMGKVVRTDRIRIEVWKRLGDVGVWLFDKSI